MLEKTYINVIESHLVVKENPQALILWHERLGHPGSAMMRKIIESSHGHSLKGHRSFKLIKCHVLHVLLEN